jgi:hypothetical protein
MNSSMHLKCPKLLTQARWGVRAVPQRTSEGAPPLLGRLLPASISGQSEGQCAAREGPVEQEQCTSWWLFTGLGVRGLLYHGIMAEQIVKAMLSHDESFLDDVVRRWQHSS